MVSQSTSQQAEPTPRDGARSLARGSGKDGVRAASTTSVSIVIPTFRRASMLSRLLADLQTQLRTVAADMEVIVVDNDPGRSAEDAVRRGPIDAVYVHAPEPGVSNARNAGVAAAGGDYILFLDDDERPAAGWLSAMLAHAEAGRDACFGRVEPDFETPPAPGLAEVLDGIFSRRLAAEPGEDVSARRAWLGTGNSLFHKSRCFPDAAPFDPRFNARGGEDIWLLRHLAEDRGIRLHWAGDAAVTEFVPADRMTPSYVRRRKFNSGQLRCLVESAGGDATAAARVCGWMAVGLVQAALHGAAWLLLSAARRPARHGQAARAAAGLGKLLWWRD